MYLHQPPQPKGLILAFGGEWVVRSHGRRARGGFTIPSRSSGLF